MRSASGITPGRSWKRVWSRRWNSSPAAEASAAARLAIMMATTIISGNIQADFSMANPHLSRMKIGACTAAYHGHRATFSCWSGPSETGRLTIEPADPPHRPCEILARHRHGVAIGIEKGLRVTHDAEIGRGQYRERLGTTV